MKLIFTFLFCVLIQLTFGAVLQNRIFNGNEVRSESVPYLARIVVYLEDGLHFVYTGSLISHYYVLTAAQCLPPGTESVKVTLGVDYIDDAKELEFHCTNWTTFSTDGSLITNISEQYFFNDIALIRLPQYVPFTKYISAVELPSYADRFLDLTHARGTISGWGETELDTSPVSPSSASVIVLDKNTCTDLFRISNTSFNAESQFCTSHLREGVCFGDNGGPLVISRYGKLIQFGIIHAVTVTNSTKGQEYSACASNYADSYTRVTSYLDFIDNNTDISIGWSQNTFPEAKIEAAGEAKGELRLNLNNNKII